MSRTQTKLIIDTKNIYENTKFSNLSALFKAVANKSLSTGKTRKNQLEQLGRYLEYRKLCEVDPTCTAKNAVIVTKIHNPPLERENDGRGKRGTYADFIRPLLILQESFEGKYTTLANRLGLFSKYFDEWKENDTKLVKQLERQSDEMDFNLWKQYDYMVRGEREYCSLISGKLRDILKSSLEALNKEGVVKFEAHYIIVPNRSITMEDYTTRPMSKVEGMEKRKEHHKAIEQEAAQKNAALRTEVAEHLIFGIDKAYPVDYQLLHSDDTPVLCSPEQESAIENYQLYVRQCAMKECCKLKELPVVEQHEQIIRSGLFFQNPRLVQTYNKIDDKLRSKLFGNIKFWQEIQYEVTDWNKAERYLPKEGFNAGQAADELSQRVLEYMERQMEKHIVEAGPDDYKDIPGSFGKVPDGPLRRYESATKFHEKLKGLYETAK